MLENLFSVCIHFLGYLPQCHGFKYHLYADDSQICISSPSLLTSDSWNYQANISHQTTNWQLKLNMHKTKLLVTLHPKPILTLVFPIPETQAPNLRIRIDFFLSNHIYKPYLNHDSPTIVLNSNTSPHPLLPHPSSSQLLPVYKNLLIG